MSSSIAEVTPPNASKLKTDADNLEKDAIGLDVAVRIHGSQVSAAALDADHAEPFEEDTSTMIVFPRGAVVKLKAQVRSGHAVVLTNLQTKRTALCRIIQVNSAANGANYVKLEFSEPVTGFWGVDFPSDSQTDLPAKPEALTNERRKQSIFADEDFGPVTEMAASGIPQATTVEPPETLASTPSPAKPVEGFDTGQDSMSYGASDKTQRDLMPLAAAPPKKAPAATMSAPAAIQTVKPTQRAAKPAPSASNDAIFDSLSTDEEVFGSQKSSKTPADSAKPIAEKRVFQASLRSLESTAASAASETPKKPWGLVVLGGIAAALVISAGGWYVNQHRAANSQTASQTANVSAPAANPVAASTPAQNPPLASSAPVSAPSSSDSSAESQVPASSASQSAKEPSLDETITVTPVHDGSPAAAADNSASSPSTSGGANIYSGDLTAKPKASKRKTVHVAAPLPKISGSVPNSIADNSELSSLVGGATSGLPAPPAAPAVSGGKIVAPRLIHSVAVTYPAIANANHVEGDVQVQTVIAPTGNVQSAKAISGPVLLREAAVRAVRQWKYSPATLDGKPISIQYMVTVRFHLNN